MSWMCPKCRSPLAKVERSLKCANGHSYDIAKQGYCNLLLVDRKKSAEPGDSEQMIAARKGFLEAQYYQYLVSAIAGLIVKHCKAQAKLSILDLGCGEGYYLRTLAGLLGSFSSECWGVDISKPAIRKAAVAQKQGHYAVASCFDLPIEARSVDLALSVFSPLDERELKRVLKKGGFFIRVSPGKQHLWELKQAIYSEARLQGPPRELERFTLVEELNLQKKLSLKSRNDLQNLLQMTPFFWHGSQEAKDRLSALDHFDVQSDFIVQLFKCCSDAY